MVLLVALAACSSAEPGATDTTGQRATDVPTEQISPPATPSVGTSENKLVGTSWQLVTLNGAQAQAGMTLNFAADTVSGSDGCNFFTGNYTIENGALVLADNLALTERACPDQNETMSRQYLDALLATNTFTLASNGLTISAEGAELVFAAATAEAITDSTPEAAGTTTSQPVNDAKYQGVFFKLIEEGAANNVIVGTLDLTLANGKATGTITARADSKSFPNDTGSIDITYQEGPLRGKKQSYTADVQLNFDNAPDYTASGSFYTVAGKLFTEQPMVLSKDGARFGKLILAEDDDN